MKTKQLEFEAPLMVGEDEKPIVVEKEQRSFAHVKQMVRWISKSDVTNLTMGFEKVLSVDEELSVYIQNGYNLFNTHYIGENPEAFGIIYILVHK